MASTWPLGWRTNRPDIQSILTSGVSALLRISQGVCQKKVLTSFPIPCPSARGTRELPLFRARDRGKRKKPGREKKGWEKRKESSRGGGARSPVGGASRGVRRATSQRKRLQSLGPRRRGGSRDGHGAQLRSERQSPHMAEALDHSNDVLFTVAGISRNQAVRFPPSPGGCGAR